MTASRIKRITDCLRLGKLKILPYILLIGKNGGGKSRILSNFSSNDIEFTFYKDKKIYTYKLVSGEPFLYLKNSQIEITGRHRQNLDEFLSSIKILKKEDLFFDVFLTLSENELSRLSDMGKVLDLGIQELRIQEGRLQVGKRCFNELKEYDGFIWFESEFESKNSLRLLLFCHYLIKNLEEGGLLIIDNFGEGFHPLIICKLIEIIQDHNLNNAQFIFASNCLSGFHQYTFDRDQVYVVEDLQATRISDFEKVPYEADIFRMYFQGRFSGVPKIKRNV